MATRNINTFIEHLVNEARTDVVHTYPPSGRYPTYPGTAEETPQETPEERAKAGRKAKELRNARFFLGLTNRREKIEQSMKDDERESGRRIGAFKHPKPEPKPEKAQPSYEDLLAGPKQEYTIQYQTYDPSTGSTKPIKRPDS